MAGLIRGNDAHGLVFLKLDAGALHFDILVGGEPSADVIAGQGCRLDVFLLPGLKGLFQIFTKRAAHKPLQGGSAGFGEAALNFCKDWLPTEEDGLAIAGLSTRSESGLSSGARCVPNESVTETEPTQIPPSPGKTFVVAETPD
jgi:hypothetical protein